MSSLSYARAARGLRPRNYHARMFMLFWHFSFRFSLQIFEQKRLLTVEGKVMENKILFKASEKLGSLVSGQGISKISSQGILSLKVGANYFTVKPCSTDTRLIGTPIYNGQFSLSRQLKSSYIFS